MSFARTVRKLLVAGGVLTLSASASYAGGLPNPAGTAIDWSGGYIGLHAGYGFADLNWRSDYPFGDATTRPTDFDNSDLIWGGHLGAQITRGPWVFGLEASLSGGFDTDAASGVTLFGASAVGDMSTRVERLLLVSARVGHTWGNMLGYAKAGYAGGTVKLSSDDNVPAPDFLSSSRDWYSGWVVGAGVEYPLAPNIIFGLEYNYVHLSGSNTTSIVGDDGSFIDTFRSSVDLDIHSLLARLSMKLDFVGMR